MQYVFVPLIVLVAAGLFWTWWSSRTDRDPVSSVHSFNRALHAMQPGQRDTSADPDTSGEPAEPVDAN